jgi:hypothetical protein
MNRDRVVAGEQVAISLYAHPTLAYPFVILWQDQLRVLKGECHAAQPPRFTRTVLRVIGILLMVMDQECLAWRERIR